MYYPDVKSLNKFNVSAIINVSCAQHFKFDILLYITYIFINQWIKNIQFMLNIDF